jgi:hypothetical protein
LPGADVPARRSGAVDTAVAADLEAFARDRALPASVGLVATGKQEFADQGVRPDRDVPFVRLRAFDTVLAAPAAGAGVSDPAHTRCQGQRICGALY